uniref:(California timema) hypothetical protein n=1 Tax=Timema californicum TaxID=61474 RepID=A0A7R9PDW4_TIMCA|nr:unnamed protein product [Timema californicum]
MKRHCSPGELARLTNNDYWDPYGLTAGLSDHKAPKVDLAACVRVTLPLERGEGEMGPVPEQHLEVVGALSSADVFTPPHRDPPTPPEMLSTVCLIFGIKCVLEIREEDTVFIPPPHHPAAAAPLPSQGDGVQSQDEARKTGSAVLYQPVAAARHSSTPQPGICGPVNQVGEALSQDHVITTSPKVLKQASLLRSMYRMNPQKRVALLETADHKLIDFVCECAYNTLKEWVPLKISIRQKNRRPYPNHLHRRNALRRRHLKDWTKTGGCRSELNGPFRHIYYNPSHPAGFSRAASLIKASKKDPVKVRKLIRAQDASTLHKPVITKFPSNKYVVSKIDDLWQANINDMLSIGK